MYKLGKRPARPDAVSFKFSTFFNASALPTPPRMFGHYGPGAGLPFKMLGNDRYGDCLVEGTIASGLGIDGAYRALYRGEIITISTASGKRLSVTPNHAVLTDRGFVRAKNLQHGNNLVSTRGTQILPRFSVFGGKSDLDYGPSPIEKIFASSRFGIGPRRKIVPTSIDLHGDERFIDGNIDIVRADSFLRRKCYAPLGQPNTKNQVRAASHLKRHFVRACSPFLSFWGRWFSAHGSIGAGGYRLALGYAQAGISQSERLALSSERLSSGNNFFFEMPSRQFELSAYSLQSGTGNISRDRSAYVAIPSFTHDGADFGVASQGIKASNKHPLSNGLPTDPHLFRNLAEMFPGLIETDRVVSVDYQRNCRTHVYDLSSAPRWYSANGIVVHNCVWAGAANETTVWNHEARRHVAFTDGGVLSDYAAVTGFDPHRPDTDQGTDMAEAASYRRKTGIVDADGVRHKIDSYVALRAGDVDQLALATYLMGAAAIGLRFPDSASTQFDHRQPWTVVPGSPVNGGHYVPCVGVNSAGHLLVVTWGRVHAMTFDFYRAYSDEAMAYVSLEALTENLSPEGFDADRLRAALAALSRGNPTKGSQSMTDQSQKVEGTAVDTGEIDAVFGAIKKLADEKVPGWERGMISDDLLREVATAAVSASVQYRNASSI